MNNNQPGRGPDRGPRLGGDGDRRPGDGDRDGRGLGIDRGPRFDGDRDRDGRGPDRGPRLGDDGDRRPGDGDRDGRGPGMDRGPRFDGDRDRDGRGPDRGTLPDRLFRDGDRNNVIRDRNYRDQFNRDAQNQRLQYLRLQNSDLVNRLYRDRYYNNPRLRNQFFQNNNFRIRQLNFGYGPYYRFRYWNQPNYGFISRNMAARIILWRAAQLGGYRYDPRDYVYRDYRGRYLGRYYWNIFQPHYRFIVPHYNRVYNGSYYVDNGSYYYYPETYATQPDSPAPPEPVEIQYGGFAHTQDLAYRFERLINDLCLDMHYNYSNNPEFDEVYRDAYDLLQAAKGIQAAAERDDYESVRAQLFGLDQLFYYVLDQSSEWERTEQRQIGEEELMAKFSVVEATMQHLMYDAGVEPSFEIVEDQ